MRNWKYAVLGVFAAGAISTGLGGSTLAAWSDTGKLGVDAKVQAGMLKLDVSPAKGATGWVDLTPAKEGDPVLTPENGKPIADLAAYRIVPGATIAYYGKVKVGLDGDNLNAKLVATYDEKGGATGKLLTDEDAGSDVSKLGVTPSVKLFKWNKSISDSKTEVSSSEKEAQLCSKQVAAATKVAVGTGCNAGVLDRDSFDKADSATHLAAITLTFDPKATSKQNETLDLKGINLSLKQVAPAAAA